MTQIKAPRNSKSTPSMALLKHFGSQNGVMRLQSHPALGRGRGEGGRRQTSELEAKMVYGMTVL